MVLQHTVEEARDLLAELALERHVLEHHDRALDSEGRGERGGHLAPDVAPADQHRPLGLLGIGADRVRVGRTRAGSGCRRGRSRPRAGDGRWRRWPAAPCRSPRSPSSTASRRARPCRASSRSSGSAARPPAPPTSPPGGRARRRGSPPRGGSPSTAAAGCTEGRARARRSGCCRRRPPRAASARSSRRPDRPPPADSRPNGRARVRPRVPRGW